MSIFKSFLNFIPLLLLILFNSCVKDIDVDQIDDVVIPPEAALDLIYFTLNSEDFRPTGGSGTVKTTDVVRLEFLDDDYIQNGLVQADLNFRYINSFPNSFRNTITFLSENNSELYNFSFIVPEGSSEAPEIHDYTQRIEGANLEAFKRSIKMRIELEMLSGSSAEQGELQLKSTAFLKLEF